jgi:hypothetical protein
MANDSHLRASEIKGVLLNQIENYEEALHAEEVGEVLEVKDGVARIYGLTKAMASEMLEIHSSETGEQVTALALNLEEDNIGAVVMGDWTLFAEEGDRCAARAAFSRCRSARATSAASSIRSATRSTARVRSRGSRPPGRSTSSPLESSHVSRSVSRCRPGSRRSTR